MPSHGRTLTTNDGLGPELPLNSPDPFSVPRLPTAESEIAALPEGHRSYSPCNTLEPEGKPQRSPTGTNRWGLLLQNGGSQELPFPSPSIGAKTGSTQQQQD